MSVEAEKYWKNKKGDLIHVDNIKIEDKLKTEMVRNIVQKKAVRGQKILVAFKKNMVIQVDDYVHMMREKHDLDVMKSIKGNLTLEAFDGLTKIKISVQSRIEFDEKLTFAKEKFDEYAFQKAEEIGDNEITTILMKKFELNKCGKVNPKNVLDLKSYDINHKLWLEGIALIDQAIEIVGSKSYMNFYQRESIEDKWKNISLDFAAL